LDFTKVVIHEKTQLKPRQIFHTFSPQTVFYITPCRGIILNGLIFHETIILICKVYNYDVISDSILNQTMNAPCFVNNFFILCNFLPKFKVQLYGISV